MAANGKKPKNLRAEIDKFLRSISYEEIYKDKAGKKILSVDGNEIILTKFAEPPILERLAKFLGVTSRTLRTWRHDADTAAAMDYFDDVTKWYLKCEAITRTTSTQGIALVLSAYERREEREDADVEDLNEIRNEVFGDGVA